MLVAVLASILMFFLIDFSPFVETVGFLAVFTEAMLGVPQFYRNFKNRFSFLRIREILMFFFNGQINIWNEPANGGHVDLWRCFQDLLLLPEEHSSTVLYLRGHAGTWCYYFITVWKVWKGFHISQISIFRLLLIFAFLHKSGSTGS